MSRRVYMPLWLFLLVLAGLLIMPALLGDREKARAAAVWLVGVIFLCIGIMRGGNVLYPHYSYIPGFEQVEINGTLREKPAAAPKGYKAVLTDVDAGGHAVNMDMVVYYNAPMEALPGDRVNCRGVVGFVNEQRRIYYLSEGIGYDAGVSDISVQGMPPDLRFAPARMAVRISDALCEMYGEQYGLIQGMLLGDKTELDQDTFDAFSSIGTSHILAVSGLHVGFIAAMVRFLLRKSRYQLRFWLSLAALWLYCLVVGAPTSAVRAAIMFSCTLIAERFAGKYDSLSAMSVAAVIILAINPAQLFRAGFLMSFAAVYGIALFAGPVEKMLKLLPKFLASSISVSASAQLGITPVLLVVYSVVQPMAIFANLLIVPMAGIVTMGALISVFAHMLLPAVAAPVAWVVQGVARSMNIVAVRFASLPFASMDVEGFTVMCAMALMAMMFFLSPLYLRKGLRRLPAVGACLVAAVAFFIMGY